MMMFNEMGMYENMDFFSPTPLGEIDVCPLPQAEQDHPVVEEDYTDDEIDVDELERRMWRDKMRLKRLKEQQSNKCKEGVDASKQRQSQEQARRKKMSRAQDGILKYMLKMMEVCKAQGFVYGIIPEKGKPVTGASDNLREWWKDKVRFDRNGPAAIAKYQAENNIAGGMGSGSLLINDCSEYDVEGFEKEQQPSFDVEEGKPEIVMMNPATSFGVGKMQMQQRFPVKEEVAATMGNFEFARKRKPGNDLNVMLMDRPSFTCENGQCPHSKINLGFNDRSSRDNHQMICSYRDNRLVYGMRPVQSQTFPQLVQPIDLSGFGVPENGQKMITELMSMYDRNVQSNQNTTNDAKEAQNNQEHQLFNRNQMFMQQGNSGIQMVFDSTPFDMASFDYRDDWQAGVIEGMGKQQQDVSTWF
ncbi:unnamed protein product [Thlaspi arvense]|uniref:Ethylene insensitive 3-like DNA-binding domain-containing protein n=1 Tax=Thlaspi arvense TaxID=13288 RepID=A0AAU9SEI0_THLAR|nr:unnamed protein product [Thlaspi arvense]